jgi:hypothetical protein
MKKHLIRFVGFFAALVFSVGVVIAASLAVSSIGGQTVSGTLTSFETTDTTPTMLGTAGADATVDITIDDLTVAVTANADGNWSYTPTSLTVGDHAVEIASNLETLSFTLTVSDGTSSSATESSTTTKGGVSTSSGELPQAGTAVNTVLLIAAGMFLMGLGVTAQQKLPIPEEE